MSEYVTDILGTTSTHAIHFDDQETGGGPELVCEEFSELILENRPGRKNYTYARETDINKLYSSMRRLKEDPK